MPGKHILAKCPQCTSGEIIEFGKFYGCSKWRASDGGCNFTIPKYFVNKEITTAIAKELIKTRQSRKIDGFKSKKGNEFSASLQLVWSGNMWRLKMRFSD